MALFIRLTRRQRRGKSKFYPGELGDADTGSEAGPSSVAEIVTASLPAEQQRKRLPLQQFRMHVWLTFADMDSSILAKHVSIVVMGTTLLSVVTFVAASCPVGGCHWVADGGGIVPVGDRSCPDSDGMRYGDLLPIQIIETVCVAIFTVEYVLRLCCCTVVMPLRHFLLDTLNIIDLAAVMPWYIKVVMNAVGASGDARFVGVIRVVRLIRVVRIFKFTRNVKGLEILIRTVRNSGPAIFILFSLTALFSIVFGSLIFSFEGGVWTPDPSVPGMGEFRRPDGLPTPFTSIPVAIYWTMVTMSTVGYGEMTPITPLGYVVGALTIVGGLVVLSLPITIISNTFDEQTRAYERLRERRRRQRKPEWTPQHSFRSRRQVHPDPSEDSSGHSTQPPQTAKSAQPDGQRVNGKASAVSGRHGQRQETAWSQTTRQSREGVDAQQQRLRCGEKHAAAQAGASSEGTQHTNSTDGMDMSNSNGSTLASSLQARAEAELIGTKVAPVFARLSRVHLPNNSGSPRPSAKFQEEEMLQRAGLADMDASLTEYRTAFASEFYGFLQKTQVELTDHACKVILLSNVMVKGVRRGAKSTREAKSTPEAKSARRAKSARKEIEIGIRATLTKQMSLPAPSPVRVSSWKEVAFASGEGLPRSPAATKTIQSPAATSTLCNGSQK